MRYKSIFCNVYIATHVRITHFGYVKWNCLRLLLQFHFKLYAGICQGTGAIRQCHLLHDV